MVDVTTPAILFAKTSTFFLTDMSVVTRNVDGEVQDPSQELLTDEGTGSDDWSLLSKLS